MRKRAGKSGAKNESKPTLRGETRVVDRASVRPNGWNWNRMGPEMYAREVESIRKHGFAVPIIVRRRGDGYEILNGEHRWRAAAEAGLDQVLVHDLGVVPDAEAKRLSVAFQELRGSPDVQRLQVVLSQLTEDYEIADLALDLPFEEASLQALVDELGSVDIGGSPDDFPARHVEFDADVEKDWVSIKLKVPGSSRKTIEEALTEISKEVRAPIEVQWGLALEKLVLERGGRVR